MRRERRRGGINNPETDRQADTGSATHRHALVIDGTREASIIQHGLRVRYPGERLEPEACVCSTESCLVAVYQAQVQGSV